MQGVGRVGEGVDALGGVDGGVRQFQVHGEPLVVPVARSARGPVAHRAAHLHHLVGGQCVVFAYRNVVVAEQRDVVDLGIQVGQ